MKNPNILLIMTDQQSADALSCAGNPYLNTPSLDRLDRASVRFDAAYSSYPLCVPARMSMFTGRMPHELGIYVNSAEADEPCAAPLVAPRLRDAGYRCHYVGKWHLTVPQNRRDEHGFEEVVFGGGYGDLDSAKAAEAAKFLEQEHDYPFFLVVSFNNPHDCCELSRGAPLRMGELPEEPASADLPPAPVNWEAASDCIPALCRFQREQDNIFRALEWSEEEVRRYRWGYNRLVEMADHEIGKVLDALERSGQWDDTLIIFTSDHGDGQGAHRWNQKWCMYDEVSRVPFMIKAPGVNPPAGRQALPVSATLDLAPTICDYADVSAPAPQRGQSLRPLIENPESCGERPFVAGECSFGTWAPLHDDQGWPKCRMIRSRRYKYIVYAPAEPPREQLFDMDNDPHEATNLAADPGYAEILERHRAWLQQWCKETSDSFATTDKTNVE